MATALAGVESGESRHVGRHVVREVEISADADLACRIVDVPERQRHVGGAREVIEPRLPEFGAAPCSLGRDREAEHAVAAELRRHLFDESGPFPPVHRDAAPAQEERSQERHAEQRILGREAKGEADHEFQAKADRRVPVRRVRVEDHDAALGHGLRQNDLPAGGGERGRAEPRRKSATSGRSMTDAAAGGCGGDTGEGKNDEGNLDAHESLANRPSATVGPGPTGRSGR
jgi:hypothetical protein